MIHLLGLCGPAQVGKDTACEQIQKLHPDCKRQAFADALKADIHLLPGISSQDKAALRDLYVAYGKVCRAVDHQYWIKRLMRILNPLDARPVIITDVRYANEVSWIQARNGIVIRILRAKCGPANHEEAESFAEIEAKYPNMIKVVNNSTPADLALRILEKLPKTG